MKLKTFFLYGLIIIIVLFFSELVNYLSEPASPSSAAVNNLLIKKAITKAKADDFDSAYSYLAWASRINILGEYGPYRKKLPGDYDKKIQIPEDEILKRNLNAYIAGLDETDISLPEDQGLGRTYYNLALISFNGGYSDLGARLLRTAMYNNPEFASFHAELINYYFTAGRTEEVNREMKYCLEFEKAKTLCGQYNNDSIRNNTPKPIGYLNENVEVHYGN
jgi:hypothetical protein